MASRLKFNKCVRLSQETFTKLTIFYFLKKHNFWTQSKICISEKKLNLLINVVIIKIFFILYK